MRVFQLRETPFEQLRELFDARLQLASASVEEAVGQILAEVRRRGDGAVLEMTRRWDYPAAERLRVSEADIDAAMARVAETPLMPVLLLAADRIRTFHQKQTRTSWMDMSRPGETLGQIVRPLRRVGIYVPGGTAAYPSTVLMTAIPAAVAGVAEIALSTPPGSDTGLPPDSTLAACRIAGVTEVYAMGGAQAVAAMAYGAESVRRVDKIVGPGNVYVNTAKRLVFGTVGIDMLAGPSEVAILADAAADPAAAAADILTQCEHDPNSSALVATPSAKFAEAVVAELDRQQGTLPRSGITAEALERNGFLVLTETLAEAADVVSLYAPEHLHMDVEEPWQVLGRIENAGAILLGRHTSAPLGDYVAGPSHTLPTAGCARFASPLSVEDFVKRTSLLSFSSEAAAPLAEAAAVFAGFEGLEGHVRAARRGIPERRQQ